MDMSTEEPLSDQDEAVLDHSTADEDDADEALDDRVDELEATVERQQQQIKDLFAMVNKLQDAADGRSKALDGLTLVEKYAKMEPAEREELIGAAERRAVVLFENWWDISKQAGNGRYVITTHRNSTKKNNPSQVKIDLESFSGEDLKWEQVYRAMRALAKLSATDRDEIATETSEYGRKHITGGAFDYEERATPDGSDTYKIVELADQNSLTLL